MDSDFLLLHRTVLPAVSQMRPGEEEEFSRHYKLLLAVLQQAFRDLIEEDGGYREEGLDCTCEPGEEDHPVKGICTNPSEYSILSAEDWVKEKSMEPFGFGWIVTKMGIHDVDHAAEAMIESARRSREDNLSRTNRIA